MSPHPPSGAWSPPEGLQTKGASQPPTPPETWQTPRLAVVSVLCLVPTSVLPVRVWVEGYLSENIIKMTYYQFSFCKTLNWHAHFVLMPKCLHILLGKQTQPHFELNCQTPFKSLWDQPEVRTSILVKYRLQSASNNPWLPSQWGKRSQESVPTLSDILFFFHTHNSCKAFKHVIPGRMFCREQRNKIKWGDLIGKKCPPTKEILLKALLHCGFPQYISYKRGLRKVVNI